MAYRLVCIFEKREDSAYRLRVEVCKDVGRMPPFLHRVDLDDVYRNVIPKQKELIYLIYHSGCSTSSPFIIDDIAFLQTKAVQNVLRKCEYVYIQNSPHGSLKRGVCPIQRIVSTEAPVNSTISKELYVRDIGGWMNKIDVRFGFENSQSLIPSGSTFDYRIVQTDSSLTSADKKMVDSALQELGNYHHSDTSTLCLKDAENPSAILKRLLDEGWKLYVPNQQGKTSRVYGHTASSGITWFSTEEFTSEDPASDKLLDSFLRSRDYVESDGKISLIDRKAISSVNEGNLAAVTGATQDVVCLYSNDKRVEKSDIEIAVRNKVTANLRPYQLEGVLWLQNQRLNGAGCLLADEMGLGKTLQVIAHLACVNTDKPHLVIAPVSLIYNWHREIERFAPQLSDQIIVTSYDHIRIHIEDYLNTVYDTIIIDEAQVIKNRDTKKYKAIAKLHCAHKIILTGTPIENSIEDIWSHFIMLNPGMVRMHDGLHRKGMSMDSTQTVQLSAKLLNRFIRRKTKAEVLTDLPEKSEETVYLDLSDKEKVIYGNLHKAVVRSLSSGLSGRINSIVLEGLLRLRQACVSANMLPASLRSSSHIASTKLRMAVDFAEQIRANGRKVLMFSQFVKALQELESLLGEAGINFVKLYGDTIDRKAPVEAFQNDDSITVFLLSLKAGGVGLNLTAADTVILLDDWWNPAVEAQAMSRAYRIGQKRNVSMYRFVCKDTVEEKILQLQEKKRSTVDVFQNTSSALSMEDIKELLAD